MNQSSYFENTYRVSNNRQIFGIFAFYIPFKEIQRREIAMAGARISNFFSAILYPIFYDIPWNEYHLCQTWRQYLLCQYNALSCFVLMTTATVVHLLAVFYEFFFSFEISQQFCVNKLCSLQLLWSWWRIVLNSLHTYKCALKKWHWCCLRVYRMRIMFDVHLWYLSLIKLFGKFI